MKYKDNKLQPKELKVLQKLQDGLINKQIAVEMGTTEQVIKNLLHQVFDKLGAENRLHAVLLGINYGLLQGTYVTKEGAYVTKEGQYGYHRVPIDAAVVVEWNRMVAVHCFKRRDENRAKFVASFS